MGNIQVTVQDKKIAPMNGDIGLIVTGTMMDEKLQVVAFRKMFQLSARGTNWLIKRMKFDWK
jgi:hypothetical protein